MLWYFSSPWSRCCYGSTKVSMRPYTRSSWLGRPRTCSKSGGTHDSLAWQNCFNQKSEVLKFVLNNPPNSGTYGDLGIMRSEFEDLGHLSIEAGMLNRPISYEQYVDESFI